MWVRVQVLAGAGVGVGVGAGAGLRKKPQGSLCFFLRGAVLKNPTRGLRGYA
jgi:hypothetical protein